MTYYEEYWTLYFATLQNAPFEHCPVYPGGVSVGSILFDGALPKFKKKKKKKKENEKKRRKIGIEYIV